MRVLAGIDSPEALRRLRRPELDGVARELREELIRLGAEIGGHFGGSLGAVELTVGLHAVFDTPRDRLVWDVGHQAYGHKALTGRLAQLPRIKKSDGPSGFLRRSESVYDVFGAGHAGTSVSAALGMAEAARRSGECRRVVAIIGDGGATAGMAFEALNHAGEIAAPLRVVLNDNGMSIAPTVGGLSRTGRARELFGALGLRYIGPVDGHDLSALLPALTRLRDAAGPAVLHVRTRKGRGFAPSEADPYGWHATTPFDAATGERRRSAGGPPSWTACFADALGRIADRDDRVVAITAAMPDGTGIERFSERHPTRVYDVGIAEQHAVTFAAGLAAEGLRPVCAIYSTFLQRAFDQIVHDVALQELPVVFALDRAGLVGGDGPTHHGLLDLSYLRMIPNLVVCAPRDENELQHQLATAIESGRPFALRFPRGAACGVRLDPVDARFAKPLDLELLSEVGDRCGAILTVEDHSLAGGFGSAVLEALSAIAPDVEVDRLGIPDRFVEHGDVDTQWRAAGIDAASIAAAAERLV
jgi:1-deoxy-D-xylulose-5-phosphate synthase